MTGGDGRTSPGHEAVLDPAALDRLLEWGGDALRDKMVALFFEHGPERMRTVRSGIETGSFEDAERAAHSLKSSAANLGARRLQELARRMEEMLEDGDGDAAAGLVTAMEEHLTEVLGALKEAGERK